MKLTKLKSWWFGLVIKFKGFELKFGGTLDKRSIVEDDKLTRRIINDLWIIDDDEQLAIEQ